MIEITAGIQYLKGVGEQRAKQLARLRLETVEDLLRHYPIRYVDYSKPYPVALAPYDGQAVVRATVYSKKPAMRVAGGRTIYRVVAGDDSAGLMITFFNSPYAVDGLKIDEEYLFYGKIAGFAARREMISPAYILASSPAPMTPVYHLTQGVTSKYIATLAQNAIANISENLSDPLPLEIREKYKLPSLYETLKLIHLPKTQAEADAAKRRLVFEELFYLQLGMKMMRVINSKENSCVMNAVNLDKFYKSLPFTPTNAQLRSTEEIVADLSRKSPMNRLLQGDVGSGKTLVAAAAMITAVENGYQCVLMAPTEILAAQHAETLQGFLEKLGIGVALLTGSTKGKAKKLLLEKIADGSAQVIVGTHALLSEGVIYSNLGLAVTDEQHRFGVRQRGALSSKATNPHLLVMSATPIPRTLSLLMFGELDVSLLDELPPNRKTVETFAVTSALRARMFSFIEKQIVNGNQAFIVCPLIEEGDDANPAAVQMQAVTTYNDEVCAKLLPTRKSGVMHGKLKPKEKAEIMQKFTSGEIDILCSTTVIEVGVDVPNANVMVIENAERYGLSALHQLRGRVGRGAAKSYCILVSDHQSEAVQNRLSFLCHTADGFEVAKYDLENRGPGDFFGERQHGLPTLKIADAMQDARSLETANMEASRILETDEKLTDPKNELTRKEVEKLFELTGNLAIN